MRDSSAKRNTDDFLSASTAREMDWAAPEGTPASIETLEVLFGRGERALEVGIARAKTAPRAEQLRKLWNSRANRGAPVLVVVLHPGPDGLAASVIGTEGDPSVLTGLSTGRVERIALSALEEPNRHQAARTLDRLLGSVSRDGLAAGLINSGLFATHELRNGVPQRSDWEQACRDSLPLLGRTGRPLLDALGYRVEAKGSVLLALAGNDGTHHAIAVVLDENESFDRTSQRFGGVSPVSQALAQAQQERLPWVLALRRNQIRLYPADPDVGVGRKGLTETYAEIDLTLLDDSDAGYLALLFSPEALERGGSVEQIIDHSSVYATELGARLRQRIYEDVIPDLAVAVARHMAAASEAELQSAYHRTLIILFRLLFVAYAEDRGLLPFERNERYTRNALKTYARDFAKDSEQVFSSDATSIWEDLVQVWNAIDTGEPRWDVPAYDGGLFSTDPATHPEGAAVSALSLTNAEVGPALRAMLVDVDADGVLGPVDFRSLSVREFGTIYEGLLESSLSFAPTDLTLDRDQTYVPAKEGDRVVVEAGEVYFHNASGQRKSTGSYFTKSFAVEHLLDTALEPALDDHLARVSALMAEDDTGQEAAEAFFDFRVADIAMGSGHFLVAAIDRIEARFSAFLAENPLPPVADELRRLEVAARNALGEQGEVAEIEPSLLLRRQIARRCIYGLDTNIIAVELARLGIWIHTFVPGLPMSSLDHGLVHGNSLTGIAAVEDALEALDPQLAPGQFSLFSDSIQDALERSRETLLKVARTSEATKQEVQHAAEEYRRARDEADEAKTLMDAAVAVRLELLSVPTGPDEAIQALTAADERTAEVRVALDRLMPAHFPCLFPEVFLRGNPGFDVILGNPPWEKVKIEEHNWWALRFPGLRSMSQKDKNDAIARLRSERPDLLAQYEADVQKVERLRAVLLRLLGGRLGSGDTDLYKMFAWRDWDLLRVGGRFGVVFPRGALSATATAKWRSEILAHGAFRDVTTMVNNAGWVFEGVHPQYSIALVAVERVERDGDREVVLGGPFHSLDGYLIGRDETLSIAAEEFAGWATGAAFPLLPSPESASVFATMREAPRFDETEGFAFRPVAELHASGDKAFFDFDLENPDGDVRVLAGASFNLWDPDFGPPYAYAKREEVLAHLQRKRQRQARTSSSAFFRMDVSSADSLPCLRPRIAFRDVTNQTNQRTVIACLLPGGVLLTHKAPFLFRRHGTAADEAYVLGIMASIPFDWYARRFVELNLTFELLSAFPLPRPGVGDELRNRVVAVAARLAAVDERFSEWLDDVDGTLGLRLGSVGRLADAERLALISELDALAALLYGLSTEDVRLVFETFHRGWDFAPRLETVLDHYSRWAQTAREAGHLGAGDKR